MAKAKNDDKKSSGKDSGGKGAGGKGKGKGGGDKDDKSDSSKVKGAQQINVRHILVSLTNPPLQSKRAKR